MPLNRSREDVMVRLGEDHYLTTGEVATLFRVTSPTVLRWDKGGIIASERTAGGHRRYSETEVRRVLAKFAFAGDE